MRSYPGGLTGREHTLSPPRPDCRSLDSAFQSGECVSTRGDCPGRAEFSHHGIEESTDCQSMSASFGPMPWSAELAAWGTLSAERLYLPG